jgi:natural product precursor
MKKLSDINGMYPNLDSTNVLSDKDMNQVLGGDDCKSCGAGCKSGCYPGARTGTTQSQLQQNQLQQVEFEPVSPDLNLADVSTVVCGTYTAQ